MILLTLLLAVINVALACLCTCFYYQTKRLDAEIRDATKDIHQIRENLGGRHSMYTSPKHTKGGA